MSTDSALQESTEHESWMRELQRRSWELELLVSGFSIFLLLQTPSLIDAATQRLLALDLRGFASYAFIVVPSAALKTLAFILALSLVAHLLLRGIWIALIGLSSVYPDDGGTDEGDRAFDPTKAILRLDQLASLMFSFSFLTVGAVLSFVLFFLVWGVMTGSAENHFRAGRYGLASAFGVPALILTISALTWLIHYLTAGRLGRSKIFTAAYAKADFILSRLTLAFAYRPIYRILATRSKWCRVGLWICFTVALIVNFEPRTIAGQFWGRLGHSVQPIMYEDHRPADAFVQNAAIQSDVIDEDVVRLFLVTRRRTLETARASCDGFGELEGKLGYSLFGVSIASNNLDREESEHVVECLADQFQILLDGEKLEDLTFFHYRHPKTHQTGLLTYVPLSQLSGNLHKLAVRLKYRRPDGSWAFFTVSQIPFWRAGSGPAPKPGSELPAIAMEPGA